jgi:multiple sugar transport system substrate-binding protein
MGVTTTPVEHMAAWFWGKARRCGRCLLLLLVGTFPAVAQTSPAKTSPVKTSPAPAAPAQTVLRIFAGPQSRSEVFRDILAQYSAANPAIRVEIVGGESIGEQRDFLARALALKEPALDLTLIDVLRPTQWALARWIEPLDASLGADKAGLLADYLPAVRESASVGGTLYALPLQADAQFFFYRRDLLEKYALKPPRDWAELKASAQTVLSGENQRGLHGLEAPGAAVESAVCTFLTSLWGTGERLFNDGKPDLDTPGVAKALALWSELKVDKIVPGDIANTSTDEVRSNFAAGNLIFGLGWGYMWPRFQNEAASRVQGKVGIARLPGFIQDAGAGCIGGWHVAVMAGTPAKAEAIRLARYLSSPATAKVMALRTGALPVFMSLYQDPEILAAQPWFSEALPVLMRARTRPGNARYSEISEAIRLNFQAVLAGSKTVDAAIGDMKARLSLIFR